MVVATPGIVTGAYTRFTFSVTGLLRPGTNSLAIQVSPNNPNTMFTLDDVDRALTIIKPQVWWPYQMGGQPLYTLSTSVSQNGALLTSTSESFGIRNVTSYLTTGTSPGAPGGARAFKINSVPLVVRGGGFSPEIFLHYSAAGIARQVALMKNMGVNTVRLEEEAQAQNYENTRAQFEAFIDHSNHAPVPSTGTIYWQLNKGGRACCGTCTAATATRPEATSARRRPTGRCTRCMRWTTGQSRWTTWVAPRGPACRWRPRCTTWPGRCSMTRPRAA